MHIRMTGRNRAWVGLLFSALLLAGCQLADLRPDMKTADDPIAGRSPDAVALYLAALERMGGGAGHAVAPPAMSLTGEDRWHVSVLRWLTPLTDSLQQFRFHSRPEKPEILYQFTNGGRSGEIIGIDALGTFEEDAHGGRRYRDSSSIRLYLEPMKNYVEWPISLFNSPVLVAAGHRVINGDIHDILFASSSSGAPSKVHDQYRLYIHRESKRVAFIEFTLRALWPSYKGALHYGDFRHIGGIVLPFRIAVSGSVDDTEFVHTFVFDHIELISSRPPSNGGPGVPSHRSSKGLEP